jgi:hypothetical protein
MIPDWDRRSEGCWESHRACNELARSEILSKGCPSQRVEFFLWKAVEKGAEWGKRPVYPLYRPKIAKPAQEAWNDRRNSSPTGKDVSMW